MSRFCRQRATRAAAKGASMVVERVRSAALRVEEAIGWVCKAAAWATLPPLVIRRRVGALYFRKFQPA